MTANYKEKGKFSLPLAIILGINTVVGAGIFTMPLSLVRIAGPAGVATVFFATICILCIGFAFARLSVILPQGGGFYAPAQGWGGRWLGIITSVTYLVGLIIALGILVRFVSSVIGVYMTGVAVDYIGKFVIAGTIIATFFASSLAAIGQTVLFVLTVVPIVVIGYLCLKQGSVTRFYPFLTNGWQGVLRGIPSVLFSFLGFEAITTLARVMRDPKRTISLATMYTIICVGIVYLFFVGAVIAGVPGDILVQSSILSEALLQAMPSCTWLVHCINSAIIVTVIGTIYSVVWSLSELLFTTAALILPVRMRLSETASLLLIGVGMVISVKCFKNADTGFIAVALCMAFVYAISCTYLIVKPARFSDRVAGVAAVTAALAIFVSAFSQLI